MSQLQGNILGHKLYRFGTTLTPFPLGFSSLNQLHSNGSKGPKPRSWFDKRSNPISGNASDSSSTVAILTIAFLGNQRQKLCFIFSQKLQGFDWPELLTEVDFVTWDSEILILGCNMASMGHVTCSWPPAVDQISRVLLVRSGSNLYALSCPSLIQVAILSVSTFKPRLPLPPFTRKTHQDFWLTIHPSCHQLKLKNQDSMPHQSAHSTYDPLSTEVDEHQTLVNSPLPSSSRLPFDSIPSSPTSTAFPYPSPSGRHQKSHDRRTFIRNALVNVMFILLWSNSSLGFASKHL